MSNSESLEDIKINTYVGQSNSYKIKSYVSFLILIAVILLVLLFLGSFGNDVFGLMVFLVIFMVPVFIIFRNKLPNILPDFITDSLYEIDNSPEDVMPVYDVNLKAKQSAYLFGSTVLVIGSIVLIGKYRNQIEDNMCFFKIMGSMVCLIFAGVMISSITGEEISLLDENSELEINE